MKRAANDNGDNDQDYSDSSSSSSSSPPIKKSTTRNDEKRKGPPARRSNKLDGGEQQETAATKAKRPRRSEEDDIPLTFPQRLMEVLENDMLNNIVSWLPHGRAFAIWDKRKFARDVMGRYFKQSKFTSFTRKLNRWGFERVARGPETGAYYHPLFQRNNLRLCLQMTCQGTKAHYQNKDHGGGDDEQEADDAASIDLPAGGGNLSQKATTASIVQKLSHPEGQKPIPSSGSLQGNGEGVPDSASTGREANLLQLGQLEGVIEQTLLKHHLANRGAVVDTTALGVSSQGLFDALVGGIRSANAPPVVQPGITASNPAASFLHQMQLDEVRRNLPSMSLAGLSSTASSSLGVAGLGHTGLSSSQRLLGENSTNHLQLQQMDDIWRMLRQQPVSTPGIDASLLGTTNSFGAVGGSPNPIEVLGSQVPGNMNVAQLDVVRRHLLLQQELQLAQQSMIATTSVPNLSVAGQPFRLASADPTTSILESMFQSPSNDYLSLLVARETAQRQLRESAAVNGQPGRLSAENRSTLQPQPQDLLNMNQHVLQLMQQANSRQAIEQQQEEEQRRADANDEKELI